MKNLIWCEVSCRRCTAIANASGWYSPDRIKRLKIETKDWQENENYGIICPDCIEDLKNLNKYKWEQ